MLSLLWTSHVWDNYALSTIEQPTVGAWYGLVMVKTWPLGQGFEALLYHLLVL